MTPRENNQHLLLDYRKHQLYAGLHTLVGHLGVTNDRMTVYATPISASVRSYEEMLGWLEIKNNGLTICGNFGEFPPEIQRVLRRILPKDMNLLESEEKPDYLELFGLKGHANSDLEEMVSHL